MTIIFIRQTLWYLFPKIIHKAFRIFFDTFPSHWLGSGAKERHLIPIWESLSCIVIQLIVLFFLLQLLLNYWIYRKGFLSLGHQWSLLSTNKIVCSSLCRFSKSYSLLHNAIGYEETYKSLPRLSLLIKSYNDLAILES